MSVQLRQVGAFLFSLLVSVLAIFILFSQVDLREVWQQIRQAELIYLVGVLLIYPIGVGLRGYRWTKLLQAPLSFGRSLHIVNISYMVNAVLPFRLGEVARIWLMSREPEHSAGEALSATAVERLFDLMLALSCVGVGLLLIPDQSRLPQNTLNALGVLIVISLVGISVILFLPSVHPFFLGLARQILRPLPQMIREKLLNFAEETLNSLKSISDWRRLMGIFFWSALLWVSYIGVFYVGLFSLFQENLPLSVGILVTGFTALGIAAPSLPGALGVYQAAAVLALTTAGYDTTLATSYAWVMWVMQTSLVILAGFIGLSSLSLSFGQITQQMRS